MATSERESLFPSVSPLRRVLSLAVVDRDSFQSFQRTAPLSRENSPFAKKAAEHVKAFKAAEECRQEQRRQQEEARREEERQRREQEEGGAS